MTRISTSGTWRVAAPRSRSARRLRPPAWLYDTRVRNLLPLFQRQVNSSSIRAQACRGAANSKPICAATPRRVPFPQPPKHVLLLNKFNVVANHMLVVTQGFEHQNDPLNEADFAATLEARPCWLPF